MTVNAPVVLIERVLGEPLAVYIKRHRDDERSLDWIARDLESRIGVRYSREWVRRMAAETEPTADVR